MTAEKDAKIRGRSGILGRTVIKRCDCSNRYQDSLYGRYNRVHNIAKSGDRCTVCKKVK